MDQLLDDARATPFIWNVTAPVGAGNWEEAKVNVDGLPYVTGFVTEIVKTAVADDAVTVITEDVLVAYVELPPYTAVKLCAPDAIE